MKSNRKPIPIILIILGISFAFSPFFINKSRFIAEDRDVASNYNDEFNHTNLKISKVSGKIHIDDANPSMNWSVAKIDGICTGNGTYSEPYVIKDLVIDGGGSGTCILIENSNVYFKIENCSLYNAGTGYRGIKLQNVNNSQLIYNDADNNEEYGIELYNSYNNTLSENIVNNNDNGIFISYSDNNTITENTAAGNTFWYGIYLSNSHNNTVLGNNASSNLNGIVLRDSYDNNISGNIANSNVYHGILLFDSHYNTFTQNMIKDNGFNDFGGAPGFYIGAGADTSKGNSIFLNCFINNYVNAFDDGVNYWDNGLEGNYWSDYTGSDADADGIGDDPYDNISGSTGSQDKFPLMICPLSPPQEGGGIPGYNLFFLLGIISVIAIPIARKVKKS